MKVLLPLVLVTGLALLGLAGPGAPWVFGVLLPAVAIAVFLVGIVWRVLRWARVPVPFRIPTTAGQQRSLAWIKNDPIDSPHTRTGVILRMAGEVLLFRSLFKNTRAAIRQDGSPRLVHMSEKLLWLGAILFHYSFLVILLRHGRFFTEPVPFFVRWAQAADGFFQVGLPVFYVTNALILLGLGYLLWRRFANPQVRYISMAADYFPLFLIIGIAATGIAMRYWFKVDLLAVKSMALGLMSLEPQAPTGVGAMFYMHLVLVCTLLIYFPFSKLLHMPGIFLSPTRNLANNNRAVRHVNPWNDPSIKPHAFAEWEEEFYDKIVACGLPVEREKVADGGTAASS